MATTTKLHRAPLAVMWELVRPILPVKIAIPYGFGYVMALHLLCSFEVGNGTADLEDAVVGTGGEIEFLHGSAKEGESRLIKLYIFLEQRGGHLGIAIHSFHSFVTFHLYLPRFEHPFADGRGGFSFGSFGNVFKRDTLNFHLQVNTIHERA